MKKLIIVLTFTVVPLLASAQLTGDGSFASPWSGTLAGDATWSGTNYINGDIIVDNEKLTISPGAVIIFTTEGADLIITGTGQLEASGTAENMIHFTADDDNDGNYGESGERWGHISFQNLEDPAPSSIINYCIIEFGTKDSENFDQNGCGGGIYCNFDQLSITNSIIRDNFAFWGGGIFITESNPYISSCLITSNKSGKTGGGLLFHNNTPSKVVNCIIINNNCEGIGGGGGLFAGTNVGDLQIYNCVIANNLSYRDNGNNIKFYNNSSFPHGTFYNSIIWGTNNSIGYTSTTKNYSDFISCAIQGYWSGYTNCFNINSDNTGVNPDGPNFSDPISGDYSITFISPCRDAGTTPSPAVPTDFIGNSRIGPYDIGAYEVQYSRWNGSAGTDWSTVTNWDGGIPDDTRDIIIPAGLSNYPISALNPDFTIGSDKQMIIEAGARLTLNDLTNNGTLKMNANVSGLSSLIMNSYTRGSGASEDIQLFLTGGFIGDDEYNVGRWHYISSPVDNFPHDIFTSTSYNLAQWIDGIQGAQSIREGWVAYDGFIYLQSDPYDPGTWTGPTFNTMTIGKGYNFFYDAGNYTYSLSGQLNTTSVPVTLDFAGEDYENGFNLLGNPFTSGLDWDYIIENTEYPENTSHGIYFTKDDVQYSYIAGVLVPEIGEPSPSGVIPPMQGFFVKTYQDNVQINLSADARTHDNIPPRYKGKAEIPLLRLTMTDNESSDETVVRFAEKANTGIDYGYDALKMFIQPTRTALYTTNGTNKFSINGQPFLEPETEIQIPLTVNVSSDGNHTISVKDIQGLVDYNLYLIDNSTGLSIDLNESASLSFSSASGLITDRFIIKINNITTAVETPEMDDNQFNIYHGFGKINLQTLSDTWTGKSGSVRIMDMGGKTVSDHQNIEFNKDDLIQMQAPVSTGLYFVEVRSGVMRYVGKVLIK